MSELMATILLTCAELDALAVAVARSVDRTSTASSASEASAVVWAHAERAGQPLCSLATMLAESADGIRRGLWGYA